MKHILFCFTLILLFTACANEKKPAATVKKPAIEKNAKPAGKKTKPAKKKKVNYKGRTKYNKGLQEELNLTDEEVAKYHKIYLEYNATRKQLPKNNKEALKKWQQEKKAAFVELLGIKKYRQKLRYDRNIAKQRREAKKNAQNNK